MRIIRLLASSSLLILGLTSAPAIAQDFETAEGAEAADNVIIVTDRRAYRGDFEPLETPNADQILNEDLLRDANALDLSQALDLSASVARQNNFGGLWNSFSVRGFQGDINLPSGFLVNGFNAGRGFGGPRDLSGIEAVEVLKGPRSALYGRGEPGGTVNLVTKRPGFETSGYVQFQGGSFDFYRGDVDLQTTVGENVGIRVAGFYEDAGSFRETVDTERFGLYPSITARLGESTALTYELEYTSQDIPFDRGVVFSDEFGFSPRRTFTGEPGDGPIETEVLGHQLELQHDFSDNWSLLAGLGYRDTSLTGNASENNFGSRQTYFIDGQTISRFFRFRDFNSEYFVARAELAGQFDTGSLRHNLIFGADYDRFENSLFILRFRPGGIGGRPISDLDPAEFLLLDAFNPVYGQFPIPTPGPNTDRNEVLKGFGFYIQDQIEITDKLQIRIGGRFDDFEQNLTDLRANPASTTSSNSDRFSPQIGAVYQINDGLSLYASYGEGFRQQTGSDFQGNQFAPNITESAEFGAKLDVGAYSDSVEGIVTLTFFQVDQSNILNNDDRPEAVAAGFFLFTAGEARSRGIEFDANLAFDNGFNFFLSYAYTDADYLNTTLDESGFGATIEAGDPLINSPDHQLSILASQDFEIAQMPAQFGGGLLYVDDRNGFAGFDFDLPSYTTVRAFAELEVAEGFVLRADVDNLFDETFYTNSFADVWVQPGAPRTFRATARYSF